MREVVESIEVMGEAEEAERRWSRFDDAWSTVHWVLSRDPMVGQPLIEGGHLRSLVYAGSFAHDMPTIDVVYEVTSTQIILQRVRFRDALSSAGTA